MGFPWATHLVVLGPAGPQSGSDGSGLSQYDRARLSFHGSPLPRGRRKEVDEKLAVPLGAPDLRFEDRVRPQSTRRSVPVFSADRACGLGLQGERLRPRGRVRPSGERIPPGGRETRGRRRVPARSVVWQELNGEGVGEADDLEERPKLFAGVPHDPAPSHRSAPDFELRLDERKDRGKEPAGTRRALLPLRILWVLRLDGFAASSV